GLRRGAPAARAAPGRRPRCTRPGVGRASRASRRRGRAHALRRSRAMTQAYRTAAAFKQALEQRLRMASASGVDFARRRQLVVFDRFLARVALELGDAITLKRGLAVGIRLERARTTKDVDLRVMGSP